MEAIGNYVLLNGKLGRITAIPNGAGEFRDVIFEVDHYGVQNNDERKDILEPIPLTEEWLLKFGFRALLNYWEKGRFKIIVIEDRFFLDSFYDYKQLEIKCVHQLQNLYFALTGEELKLKE